MAGARIVEPPLNARSKALKSADFGVHRQRIR
jgi:hypothetical protein